MREQVTGSGAEGVCDTHRAGPIQTSGGCARAFILQVICVGDRASRQRGEWVARLRSLEAVVERVMSRLHPEAPQ